MCPCWTDQALQAVSQLTVKSFKGRQSLHRTSRTSLSRSSFIIFYKSFQHISTTSEKEQNQCQDKHQQHGSEDHFGLPSGPMQFTPDQHPPGGADQRLTPRDGHRNGVPQHSTCLNGEQTAQAVGKTSREAQEVLPGRQFWIAPNKKAEELREIAGIW